MATITADAPQAMKDMLAMMARRQVHDTRQHRELFQWKDRAYRSWVVDLESMRPVLKKFGNRSDAFNFNNAEFFDELRHAVMLEF